jgi:pilus assembly protein FimV
MAVQRDKVIASAEKLVAKGKVEAAIKEYERLLDDNPNDVNTLNRIGDLWVRINRNDEAVKVFTKIADHYSKDGFFLKAIAIYKKINKLDPSKLEIYAKLADLYAKQGLAMEAKSQYQVLADYYLKHGDPGNALGIYRKISELDPSSINVHVKLADLYSQNNQTGDALKEYDRVGRMLLKRGMLDEAVQVFRKALKIDGRNVELVESLVTALIEAKDYDNAAQIVETALDSNQDNPRLLALLGRIHLSRGDANAARASLERGIRADPNDPVLRETLADLYLKQGNPSGALEMLTPQVEKYISRGERGTAVEMLNRILRVDAGHTPTLERLVAVYTRLNEETNILAAMNSLAEAHMARGNFEQAATVVEKLIQREPQNAQHRNKLTFVKSQIGGVDTLPARPRTAHETPLPSLSSIPPMEIEEPAPSFDLSDTSDSFSLDLDAAAPMEIELEAPPPITPSRPQMAPPPRIDAPPMAEEEVDDLDFITEHLTEAEVFAKYGLAEKATEHLRTVIERAPRHLTAHERLFRILLDEGDVAGARVAAQQYVSLLEEKSDDDAITAVKNEFVSRGHSFERAVAKPVSAPTVERAMPRTVERAMPSFAPPPALEIEEIEEIDDELSFDLDSGADLELESTELSADALPDMLLPEDAGESLSAAAELGSDAGPDLDAGFSADFVGDLGAELSDDFASGGIGGGAGFDFSGATADIPSELRFDEEAVAPPAPLETPAAELTFDAPAFEPLGEEPSFDLPSIDTPSFDTPSFDAPSFQIPTFDSPATPSTPVETLSLGDSALSDSAFGEVSFEMPSFDEPEAIAPPAEESFFGVDEFSSVTTDEPAIEEIGEIDFYIQQELFDEARQKVETLLARYPGNSALQGRQQRIERAASAAGSAAAAAPAPSPSASRPSFTPSVLSRDEIERELLSAIPDDDEEDIIMAAVPPPSAPIMSAPEENLFADEDDFFDLAAELESELAEEEPIALAEEEQSLEEIFKEFKKGVEQQLDSEDYDTHYNLGIAYKEMGLIDEAIGEFQLASKDPKRAVECASMLGLCFLEKGMPQLAIKWYRKGLEMAEITEEEHLGVLYDLGCAYMEVGDTENAQRAFMEVYGMNTNYREIVSRIKQLEGAR